MGHCTFDMFCLSEVSNALINKIDMLWSYINHACLLFVCV